MSRNRWILVVAVVLVVAAGAWYWRGRSAAAAPKYRTAEVARGSVESVVSATGTIRPVVQVEVGSQVSGTVASLHADFNSRVRAGQVVLQLEQSSFRAREVQAEAAVARAEASVKDAERALARARELRNQDYISQADLDAAAVAVELRKADLKQAQAQLEAAQVDLAHTTIRSPIDGVVIARSIDLGQTVAASLQAPKLFVIANDLSQMQVESRIDEADIGQIQTGQSVAFTVDAFPDRIFSGRVSQVRLEPIVEAGVVTYTTVIHTRNEDLQLRPGMTANVTVKIERREDVLRIPNAALRFRMPGPPGGREGGPTAAMRPGGGAAAGEEASRRAGVAQASTRKGPGQAATGPAGPGGAGEERAAAERRSAGGASGAEGARGERGGRGERGERRGAGPEAGRGEGDLARRGTAGSEARAPREAAEPGAGPGSGAPAAPAGYKPGSVYALRAGKPVRVQVLVGITDGTFTEVRGDGLEAGDLLVIGADMATRNNLQPPPGMGGPQFRRPGRR